MRSVSLATNRRLSAWTPRKIVHGSALYTCGLDIGMYAKILPMQTRQPSKPGLKGRCRFKVRNFEWSGAPSFILRLNGTSVGTINLERNLELPRL